MEKRREKGKLLVISKKLFFSTVDDQKKPKDNDSSIKDFD